LYEAALCFDRLGDRDSAARVMRQAATTKVEPQASKASAWLAASVGGGGKEELDREAGVRSLGDLAPSTTTGEGGSAGGVVSLPYQEFGFENVSFADVLTQAGAGLSALDATARMLRARSDAAERHAQSLRSVQDARRGSGSARSPASDSGGGRSDGLLAAAWDVAGTGLALLSAATSRAGVAEGAMKGGGVAVSDRGTLFVAMDALVSASQREAQQQLLLAKMLRAVVAELVHARRSLEKQLHGLAGAADQVVQGVRAATHAIPTARTKTCISHSFL
jgi:hypothetical protein